MISIVVCTRNRAAFLPQTLMSYLRICTSVAWELIVVNNGSTDGTADILNEFVKTADFHFKVVYERRPGLCCARNAGWRAAEGSLVAFTDDDCYPEPDFVDCIDECFREKVDFIGGRVLLHDPTDYPITIQLSTEPQLLPPGTFIESGLIHGANLAVRAEVLRKLDGFDEYLGAGTRLPAGDDVDFVNRASAAGYIGKYDPRPAVQHHHRRRLPEQVAALTVNYDIGRGANYAKGVLDEQRRRQVIRQWYWRSVLPSYKSRRGIQKLWYELVGAARYSLLQARLSWRGKSKQHRE